MDARTGSTLVDICFAVGSGVSWFAGAVVVVDSVEAGAVDAWIRETFIDICLAVGSRPSRSAVAGVFVRSVNAVSIVQARMRKALIDINVAVYSGVSWLAFALVISWEVLTRSMDAGIGLAFVDFGLAMFSGVTNFTTTFVFVVQLFAFTVNAWVRSTLLQHLVALHSSIFGVADAFV